MRTDSVAAAHARLRRLIVGGAIAPGSQLSQVELARRLGVSTTPLREALRRLEAEGLVDSTHNRRPRVRPFDVEELDSIYAARVLLECLALRLTAPAMTDAQLAGLREHVEKMIAANDGGGTTAAWEKAHDAFHRGLVAAAAPPLKVQIDNLMARGDRYARLGIRADEPPIRALREAEHEAIEEACRRRDAVEAAALLAAHLARSAHAIGARIAAGRPLPAVDAAIESTYPR